MIPHRSRHSAFLLVAVAMAIAGMATPVDGLFNRNKNRQKQVVAERRQLSEQERQAADWDMDASTGTVRKVVSEAEQAAAQAERTCDGQMAISLVKANDDKLRAETERDLAVEQLDAAKRQIIELKSDLKVTGIKLTEELTTTTERLNEQIKQLEEALSTTGSDASKKMREMQEEANAKLDTAEKKAKEEISFLKTAHESKIQEITSAKDKKISDMAAEHDATVSKLREEADSATRKITQSKEQSESELKEEIEKLTQKLKSQEESLKQQYQSLIDKANQDRDEKVGEISAQLESVKAGMTKTISEKETETKKMMDDAAAKLQKEKDAIQKKSTDEKNALKAEISNLESKVKTLGNDNKSLKAEVKKSAEELKHWNSVFGARSYCNLTHISEDATVAAAAASETAGRSMRLLARQSSEKALKLKDDAVKASEPYMKKAQELYDVHVKKHVDAARPHYNQYAAPVVNRAAVVGAKYHQDYGLPAYAAAKEYTKSLFDDTLRPTFHKARLAIEDTFARECPVALKATRKAAKDLDVKIPAFVDKSWKSACDNPAFTVSRFFNFIGLLTAFFFRHRILRLTLWMIMLPFKILWFFFPLRFFFPSSKKTPASPPADSTNRPKTNGMTNGKASNSNGLSVKKKKGKK